MYDNSNYNANIIKENYNDDENDGNCKKICPEICNIY